jgi:hypothetical protein
MIMTRPQSRFLAAAAVVLLVVAAWLYAGDTTAVAYLGEGFGWNIAP